MDDPNEYINREVGFSLDFMIPPSAAEHFIAVLYTEHKQQASPIIQSLLERSISQPSNLKVTSAALHLIEVTSNTMLSDKNLKKSVPQLLTQFVYPSLMSNELILKYRMFTLFI